MSRHLHVYVWHILTNQMIRNDIPHLSIVWPSISKLLAHGWWSQALVSFKKYMPPLLPYFKVNIYPFPLPHFASICFAYLWSFCWSNYIVTLPRYFSFRLPHLNIPTRRIGQEYSANVAWSTFQSLKRIQALPICAGFFICIRNSLDRPCVTMPSWSSPLKCKVSL